MAQITNEMVQASYDIGKKVFQGELIQEEGVEMLNSEYGMDKGSAVGYINNYKCMINGEQYTWTINEYATKYYLIKILLDNGEKSLVCALDALAKHLEYQDNIGHNAMISTKKIYNTFLEIRNTNCSSIVSKIFELF
jgi:5-methylcytosine-specific restriction protein A